MHHAVHRNLVTRIDARKGIRPGLLGGIERHRAGFTGVQECNRDDVLALFENRPALGGDVTRADGFGPHAHHVGEYFHAATGLGEDEVVGLGLGVVVFKLHRETLTGLGDKPSQTEVHVGVHPNLHHAGIAAGVRGFGLFHRCRLGGGVRFGHRDHWFGFGLCCGRGADWHRRGFLPLPHLDQWHVEHADDQEQGHDGREPNSDCLHTTS